MKMLEERPSIDEVIVKLNEGVSGAGNALVDLRGIADTAGSDRRAEVAQRPLDAAGVAHHADGRIRGEVRAERRRRRGADRRSGATQPQRPAPVLPDRSVELLSTHDQLLGGASGQSYLGCIFPADPAYSRLISAPAITIGERLAREGALGRFAIDFVVKRDTAGRWSAYAIELNLRKGGTHPFLTLQFLTDGSYDGASGRPSYCWRQRHLVATDHLESSELRALAVEDLFDIVARHGCTSTNHGRPESSSTISSLTEHGRIGLTAVGQSPEEAMRIYQDAQQVLSPRRRRPVESRLPG